MKESESSLRLLENSVAFTLEYFFDLKKFTNDRGVFYQYWMQHIVGATVLFQRCLGDSPCAHANSERVLADCIIERRSVFGSLKKTAERLYQSKSDSCLKRNIGVFKECLDDEMRLFDKLSASTRGRMAGLKQNEMDFIFSISGTMAFFLTRQIESRSSQSMERRTTIITRILKSTIASAMLPLFRAPGMDMRQAAEQVILCLRAIAGSLEIDVEDGFFDGVEE